MSIRPIDSQGVLQRTSELQKTTAVSREQQQHARHHFEQQLQQVSAREQRSVRQSEDTEKNDLRQSPERQRKRQPETKRRKNNSQEAELSAEDAARGRHLDIKA